jgi:type IV pilus assembly protein PilV
MNGIVSPPRARGRSAGFTLIEVLISILIFSLGLLGLVGLQARMLQAATQNSDRARASLLANEIVSVMWARQTTAVTGLDDYAKWQARVAAPAGTGLPGGKGVVSAPDAQKQVTVTISWRPPSMTTSAVSNQFTTTVAIP